jgi:hypothetical protein
MAREFNKAVWSNFCNQLELRSFGMLSIYRALERSEINSIHNYYREKSRGAAHHVLLPHGTYGVVGMGTSDMRFYGNAQSSLGGRVDGVAVREIGSPCPMKVSV